jgi:hypothetical protein
VNFDGRQSDRADVKPIRRRDPVDGRTRPAVPSAGFRIFDNPAGAKFGKQARGIIAAVLTELG